VEISLIGLCYWAYTLTRNAVPAHEVAAMHRAEAVLRIERALHVNIELAVNQAVASVRPLAIGMNYYYATLHFVVTIGVLVWLYVRRPAHYRAASTVLFGTTGLALVGFYLFALAPPRFLSSAGFVDTVAVLHTWGSYASGDLAAMSNQYAAMPSLHISWSLWSALTVFLLTRRTWVRVLAALYPVATLAVILGTANHFVFDALGGVVVLGAGFGLQRLLLGGRVYRLG
jgi:hypothetical protein